MSSQGSNWVDLGPCGCCGPAYPYYQYSNPYYGYYPYYAGGGGGGGGGVLIPITCCNLSLPEILHVSIFTTGDCSLPASMTITWDGTEWTGEISTGGIGDCGTFTVTMTQDCKVTIVYGANEGPDGFGIFVSLNCSPFMLTYTRSDSSPLNNSPCCSGGITITITE